MKSRASIRFTLVVYCTTLLAITTATVSILGYRTSLANLESRRTVTRQLLETQFVERCRELEENMDNELLSQAQGLATLIRYQTDWPRIQYHNLILLGVIGNTQNTHFVLPVWFSEIGPRGTLSQQIFSRISTKILIDPERLQGQAEFPGAEYYQISTSLGATTLSKTLNGSPMDPNLNRFAPDRALYWEADETRLADGKRARRVRLKTSGQRFFFPTPQRRPEGGRASDATRSPDGSRPNNPPRTSGDRGGSVLNSIQPWSLYIQVAYDYARFENRVTEFRQKRDNEMAERDAEAESDLAVLTRELVVVGLLSFIAATVGLWALFRQGLNPLSRLSDAVSRINPENFTLNIEESRLPTELRPIASRLKVTLAQLSRAFAREKQATADISHELRTPLAALLTTCELALRKTRTIEEYKEFISECHSAGIQMNRAVDRLLTLARLDAGADAIRKTTIDVNTLVRSCVNQVENLAEVAQIRIQLETSPIDFLSTDPDKLSEVILNLLHNGIQYNRPGGAVTVRTRQKEGHVEISVVDTGIGIKPEDRELIFERFFRVDPSRTSDGMNSGLGLSIVKGFVELMGGAIQVESTLGVGSTFRLLLPLEKNKTQAKVRSL